MDAYGILVIILSITLAIFLVVSIIVGVMLMKILKKVQHIVEQAEHVADNAVKLGETIHNIATPVAAGKLFSNIAASIFSKKSAKKEGRL